LKRPLLTAFVLLFPIALSCTKASTPAIETSSAAQLEAASAPACSTPSPSCDYLIGHSTYRDDMTHKSALYGCALWFAACTITPDPKPPQPPMATGGSVSTGGSSATGGANATGGTTAAPSTSPEALACANIAKLCPPKTVGSCLSDVAKIEATPKYASIDLNCLIKATSQTAMQACKSVVCGSVK
jgi:hypothetical protein